MMTIIHGENAKNGEVLFKALTKIDKSYVKKSSELFYANQLGQCLVSQGELSKNCLAFFAELTKQKLPFNIIMKIPAIYILTAACAVVMYQINRNTYSCAGEDRFLFNKNSPAFGKAKLFMALLDLVSTDSSTLTAEDVAYLKKGVEGLKQVAAGEAFDSIRSSILDFETDLNNLTIVPMQHKVVDI